MSKNTIITIVLVVLGGGVGFFAGTKYQSSKSPFGGAEFSNVRFGGQAGQMVQFRNGNGDGKFQVQMGGVGKGVMMRGGQVIGEIIGADDKSVTVRLPDGSSKIVIFTDKTTISKSTDGTTSDLKTGENVAVFGATNSDGSVTATNIQLNPAFKL